MKFRVATLLLLMCSSRGSSAAEQDWQTARSTSREFLTVWYVKRDFNRLLSFVAQDNQFLIPEIRAAARSVAAPAAWLQVFRSAFSAETRSPPRLEDAIEYPLGAKVGPDQLHPLNLLDSRVTDPFAILDAESLPPGSVFPASRSPSRKLDVIAAYLDRIHQKYKGRIYLTLYATKAPWLRREEGILIYWVRTGSNYRLAMLHPVD